jgi:hypothetical protein
MNGQIRPPLLEIFEKADGQEGAVNCVKRSSSIIPPPVLSTSNSILYSLFLLHCLDEFGSLKGCCFE